MAFDSSIILKGVPVDAGNLSDMYAKAQANKLARTQNEIEKYKLSSAQRADEVATARTNALAEAGGDPVAVYNALLKSGDTKGAMEWGKHNLEQDKTESELATKELELSRQTLNHVNDPNSYMGWVSAQFDNPRLAKLFAKNGVTREQALARAQSAIAQGPQAFIDLVRNSAMSLKEMLTLNKPTTHVIDQGGQKQVVQVPGLGGDPTTVGTYKDVPLPPEVEDQKQKLAQAGAARTSVNVDNRALDAYRKTAGEKVAQKDVDMQSHAEAAPAAAENAQRIIDLIDSGKVITGSFADQRLAVAKMLNVDGKDDQERIKNTEVLKASLAQQTLDRVKTSGLGTGNGFTQSDRDYLEKAVAGKLDSSPETIRELARIAHKVAMLTADRWNTRVKSVPADVVSSFGWSKDPIVIQPLREKQNDQGAGGARSENKSRFEKAAAKLKAGQGTPEEFDAIFGPGAAARAMKGQ